MSARAHDLRRDLLIALREIDGEIEAISSIAGQVRIRDRRLGNALETSLNVRAGRFAEIAPDVARDVYRAELDELAKAQPDSEAARALRRYDAAVKEN